MTTLFKAPQIGDAVESGKQVQFRWRSSSSSFHNPRETKLAVRYKLKFGPGTGSGNALTALKGGNLPSNVRFTACPNTALFADGCQYQVNSTMVENQPNYYDACKVKLYTKYDSQADTSGSCGLLTRRKDLHAPTKNGVNYPASDTDDRDGVSERAELCNPKQEIIRQAFRKDAMQTGEIELLDNIWLSSFEHGYFVAGADHELTLTFAQNFADMFHSQSFVYKGEDASGDPTTVTQAPFEHLVVGKLPGDNACAAKTIYCEITDIALHVAMAGSVPSIPPSVALKYSELMIVNRDLTQQQNEISLVVPPSTRALYCFSRQQIHDVRADAEELGLAGAGIDEVGLCGAGAGDTATIPHTITNLILELGGQLQPGNGGYNNMDVTQFKAGRAFTDALSVVGKPSAMRGTTWDFVDWCGKKSANGRTFPTDATGQIGFPARDVADETFGDQGPGYFVRMILPPNSLSNVLTVRCTLDDTPLATAKQQLTIVAVHDSLWTMQYAPPAELPVETKVSPIT